MNVLCSGKKCLIAFGDKVTASITSNAFPEESVTDQKVCEYKCLQSPMCYSYQMDGRPPGPGRFACWIQYHENKNMISPDYPVEEYTKQRRCLLPDGQRGKPKFTYILQ